MCEKSLWNAVLRQQVHDAAMEIQSDEELYAKINKIPKGKKQNQTSQHNTRKLNKHQAIEWINSGSQDFGLVCQLAGRDPEYTQRKILEYLKDEGVI